MTSDVEGLDPTKLAYSQNMRMARKGYFYTRFGISKRATIGSSAIDDMHPNHQRDVLFMKTGTGIHCTVDGPEVAAQSWYDTGVVRTASAADVLHDFGSYIIATNGTDNLIRIISGIVATQFTAASTTIVLDPGHNTFFRTPLTAAYTADSTTDTLTSASHGLATGDRVAFYNTGGALPGGISEYVEYFVLNASTNTFQIAATYGGAVIDISSNGSGTNTFTAGICYCMGKMFTYTAKSGNTFTGCRVQSGTYTVGLAVTQSFDPLSAKKGRCLYDLDEKILTGGVDGYEDVLYYTATSDEANPDLATDFVNFDAGGKRMPSKITALMGGSGVVLIGLKKGIYYAHSFDIGTGALITRRITDNHGVPNAHCIVYMDPYYYVWTGRRLLQIIADKNGVQIVEPQAKTDPLPFDYPVQKFFEDCDTDQDMSYGYHDPELNTLIYNVVKNGIGYEVVNDNNNKRWVSIDVGKPGGCRTGWRNRSWIGGVVDGKIYLDDEGLVDDDVTILHRVLTGEHVYDDGRADIDLTDWIHSGLLNATGEFDMRMYTGGELAFEETIRAQDDPASNTDGLITLGLMSLQSGKPIGGGQVGAKSFGHGGVVPDVYNYDYPKTLLDVARRVQFEFEVNSEGTQWALGEAKVIGETNEQITSIPTQ